MIVGLTGVAQVGKDTAAKALIEDGYKRVGFADALREILYALNPLIPTSGVESGNHAEVIIKERETVRLREIVDVFGWDGAKQNKEVRELLQRLGTEGGRKVLWDDIWIDAALNGVSCWDSVVLTDVRFDNEAAALREMAGVVIKVVRPGYGPINTHASDAGISAELVDHVIANDGTVEELHAEIRRIVENEQHEQRSSYRLKRAA